MVEGSAPAGTTSRPPATVGHAFAPAGSRTVQRSPLDAAQLPAMPSSGGTAGSAARPGGAAAVSATRSQTPAQHARRARTKAHLGLRHAEPRRAVRRQGRVGQDHPGHRRPGKTGWLYLLNRATGKPPYGVVEKKVPQDAAQKTAKTQPFPKTGLFIKHGPPSAAEIARVKKETTGALKKVPVVIAKDIFTRPPVGKMLIYGPGPAGGNNWMPSSYNQKTQMFYIGAVQQVIGVEAARNTYKPGQSFSGVAGIAGIGFGEASGTFTAIDATTGKVKWQHTWKDACYSGTSTSAGNLVFVGRSSGAYQAYNATTGKLAWSFQTGAGANDVGTIFENEGKEYIALLSAGNSLVASPHGDSVWLFGLDGKGRNGGPDLTTIPSAKNVAAVVKQVTNGGGGMPPFKGSLSAKQIKDVAAFVTKKITNK
jgi:glucose dehydrogenase